MLPGGSRPAPGVHADPSSSIVPSLWWIEHGGGCDRRADLAEVSQSVLQMVVHVEGPGAPLASPTAVPFLDRT
jgi:hypothetical protein